MAQPFSFLYTSALCGPLAFPFPLPVNEQTPPCIGKMLVGVSVRVVDAEPHTIFILSGEESMIRMSLLPLPDTDNARGLQIRLKFTRRPQYARVLTSLFCRQRGGLREEVPPGQLGPGLGPKSLHSLSSPELSL